MPTKKYTLWTKEFEVEAVRLADESDKPVAQIAREPGKREKGSVL